MNQITCNVKKTLLASCSDDGTARIWSVADLTSSAPADDTTRLLQGHEQPVSGIMWGLETKDGEHDILATYVSCSCLDCLPHILTGSLIRSSFDQTCRLWDGETGDCLHVFSEMRGPIFALAFSPDTRFIATGTGDGWLHIYDLKVSVIHI